MVVIYEAKEGEPDHQVVAEVRRRHRLRNDSRIADLFEGYFKSTVVCPHCRRVSVTFDPFMSVAVPLSAADSRKLAVTLRTAKGELTTYRVSVPMHGTVKQLLAAVVDAASPHELNVPSLVCVEVYNAKLQAIYPPSAKLDKLQNGDYIFVCETTTARSSTTMQDDDEEQILVVAVQRCPPSGYGASTKFMGLPITILVPANISGRQLINKVRIRRHRSWATPA